MNLEKGHNSADLEKDAARQVEEALVDHSASYPEKIAQSLKEDSGEGKFYVATKYYTDRGVYDINTVKFLEESDIKLEDKKEEVTVDEEKSEMTTSYDGPYDTKELAEFFVYNK